jgi:hypothetical protein
MKRKQINNQMAKIQKKGDSIHKKIQKLENTLIQAKNKKKYKTKEPIKEFTYISLGFNFQVYLTSQVNQ